MVLSPSLSFVYHAVLADQDHISRKYAFLIDSFYLEMLFSVIFTVFVLNVGCSSVRGKPTEVYSIFR